MDDAKQQLVEQLTTSTNILVTIGRDPSIDQVASCLGLTLLLNKMGKHATAVFSGTVPSTLEFLKPDETIEKNTDSLRDFIIAIDKAKADKLRYKVENDVVRIFITPYKSSISEDDLVFSEGDFNVDVVVALGVSKQEDLDQAITDHGRILHDATITSITNVPDEAHLGTINWHDAGASSVSELVTELAQTIDESLIDEQISTALLTGIVSETDRFSNEKTSSMTMSLSAILMAAGADQQLVASKLEADGDIPLMVKGGNPPASEAPRHVDGELDIDHSEDGQDKPGAGDQPKSEDPMVDDNGQLKAPAAENTEALFGNPFADASINSLSPGAKLVTEPPTMGGTLTANSQVEALDPSTDPLSQADIDQPLLNRNPAQPFAQQPGPGFPSDISDRTLTDLEQAVDSPHVAEENLDNARDEVEQALNESAATATGFPEPAQSIGAQPMGGELQPDSVTNPAPDPMSPQQLVQQSAPADPNAPPPVPPPIPFQFGTPQEPPKQ